MRIGQKNVRKLFLSFNRRKLNKSILKTKRERTLHTKTERNEA